MSETAAPAPVAGLDVVAIPADACYWCLLEGSAARLDPRARAYQAERFLPLPIERLHLAEVRLDAQRVLVAAIEPDRLRELLANVPAGAWAARPRNLPAHLAGTCPEEACASLDFLRGPFEAASRRRARRLLVGIGLILLCGLGSLVAVGVQRRTGRLAAEAALLRAQSAEIYAQIAAGLSDGSGLSAELAVEQELRRVRAARQQEGAQMLADAVPVCEALWRAWPGDQRIQLDTLTVDGRQVVLRAAVPDLASAQACVAAWQGVAPNGTAWVLATPEILLDGERVQIIARLQAPALKQGLP